MAEYVITVSISRLSDGMSWRGSASGDSYTDEEFNNTVNQAVDQAAETFPFE